MENSISITFLPQQRGELLEAVIEGLGHRQFRHGVTVEEIIRRLVKDKPLDDILAQPHDS